MARKFTTPPQVRPGSSSDHLSTTTYYIPKVRVSRGHYSTLDLAYMNKQPSLLYDCNIDSPTILVYPILLQGLHQRFTKH